jgi:DNA-binding LytR/AlgR family response regulator
MIKNNILIVEDEYLIAMEIKDRLEKVGYNIVDHCSKPEKLKKIISNNQVDLILMDIRLGGELDGIDLAEMVNREFKIPVIYITAYSDIRTIEKAKHTSAYGYILKPIKGNELIANIEIALGKAQNENIETENNGINIKDEDKKIIIWENSETFLINPSEILFLKVEDGLVEFVLISRKKIKQNDTLKKWTNKLKRYGFYRCHKNYLINILNIEKLIPDINNTFTVKMKESDEIIPVARNKMKELKELLEV